MLTSNITTNINEIKISSEFSIYPNPSNSIININSEYNLLGKTYIVQNVAGQTVLTGKSSNNNFFSIDFSLLENGIYFVSIDKNTFKVIKQWQKGQHITRYIANRAFSDFRELYAIYQHRQIVDLAFKNE